MTAAKIRDGAVGTTKIADGGVTSAKLTPSERGEGFVTTRPDPISLPATTAATVATLNLPTGSFIVTAAASLGGAGVGANYILCELRDDGAVLTTGTCSLTLAVYMETVTLTGGLGRGRGDLGLATPDLHCAGQVPHDHREPGVASVQAQ